METAMSTGSFIENYNDAKGYYHRSHQFLEEGHRASLVFNVAAIALEKYLIALCNLHGISPENHTYTWLVYELATVMSIPSELKKEIQSMDIIFGICSIENYNHQSPGITDRDRIMLMCSEVQKLIQQSMTAME